MVGGRDFDDSHFNRAVQAHRQPGSAFKPFVYAAALEAGFTPATVIDHLDDPIATAQGAWTPEDEHSSAPSMSLRTGLRTSSNRAAVRLLQQVGIPRTVQYAKTMGVGDVPSVPSLALGSGEVTLQSMTAAYAAFANHGLVPQPTLIRRVEDRDGRVLYQSQQNPVRAISDTTAFLMSTMLADVINAGTGAARAQLGFTLPAAGKTGTTNDFNDAWFIGFTPKLVTGVWVGFDQPHTILPERLRRRHRRAGVGEVHEGRATQRQARVAHRAGRRHDRQGLPPLGQARDRRLPGCRGRRQRRPARAPLDGLHGIFRRGTEPTTFCDQHPTRGIMTKLAGLFGGTDDRPAPPRVEDTGIAPPSPTATTGSRTEVEMPQPVPPQKKRGFWSRVFGRDDDQDQDWDEQEPPKKKGG